jgi:hypothetical protein
VADPQKTEFDPHAEREFTRYAHELGKVFPGKLREAVVAARSLRAATSTTRRKAKG